MEENQYNDEQIKKIKQIIEQEIEKEIISKQDEVMDITDKIEKALRNLAILKYVVAVNYYENNPSLTAKKVNDQEEESKDLKIQNQIHPCIKKLFPFHSNYVKSLGDGSHSYETRKKKRNSTDTVAQSSITKDNCTETENKSSTNEISDSASIQNENSSSTTPMPQYIPPLPNPDIVKEVINSTRGGSSRVQHRIIIGNISKWISPDTREDNSTHKWMVYIRNLDKDKDVTQLIHKVRYFLHESYKPHDIIDVTSAPFHLTRRGWGEFPIRVQLHFHHPLNKPVDIIHNLKLDMTCSGVQTLGAETVVELSLHHSNTSSVNAQAKNKTLLREDEYANGKKTIERGDVYDDSLLMPINGITCEGVVSRFVKKEETDESLHNREVCSDDNSANSEKFNSLFSNSDTNLMLDRRKLQDIIAREHDYIKCEKGEESSVTEPSKKSLLKLLSVKNIENNSYKNGTVLDSVKHISVKNQKINLSLGKCENEIFRNFKSVVSKLEHDTQSKYSLKAFKHSYMVSTLQEAHATNFKTIEPLIKWFCRRWPIITKLALSQTYKHIHPYSCSSEEEFFQYNIGKQRSAEWFRAKAIQKVLISLKPIIPIEEEVWTTKHILLWSRFHGYSPICISKEESKQADMGSQYNSKRLKSNDSSSDTDCDSSDYITKRAKSNDGKCVNGLFLTEKKKNFKRGRKKYIPEDSPFQAKSYRHTSTFTDSSDVTRYGSLEYRLMDSEDSPEIDVVTVEDSMSKSGRSTEKYKDSCLTVSTTPRDQIEINKFVWEAARQIGIRISNEEVTPGVMCDSTVRVMSQAAFNFLDELLRKSLAQAWLRNNDRAPSSLEYEDVLAAIVEHPQFDVFTNRGLGVQSAIKTEI